jgi:predicted RNase H-like nuclease
VVVSAKLQGIHLSPNEPELLSSLAEVLDARPQYQVLALHAPVGLLSVAESGGRRCDQDARALLGPDHAGSISSPPTWSALEATTYDQAATLSGGLDAATWSRIDRLREIQREMAPYRQRFVYEVHAELTYFQLNGERPLKFPKRTNRGRDERRALLEARMPDIHRVLDTPLPGVRPWHLLDGSASLWTSRRIIARSAARLPESPEWDDRGLRMEIVR